MSPLTLPELTFPLWLASRDILHSVTGSYIFLPCSTCWQARLVDFVRIAELISNVCIRRLLPWTVDIRGEYELWRRWTIQFSKHCYRMSAGLLEQCQLYWGWLQSYAAARSKMLDEWTVVWTEKWPHIDRHHSLLPQQILRRRYMYYMHNETAFTELSQFSCRKRSIAVYGYNICTFIYL